MMSQDRIDIFVTTICHADICAFNIQGLYEILIKSLAPITIAVAVIPLMSILVVSAPSDNSSHAGVLIFQRIYAVVVWVAAGLVRHKLFTILRRCSWCTDFTGHIRVEISFSTSSGFAGSCSGRASIRYEYHICWAGSHVWWV